ncbi:cupin domain-containing protein [Vibrio aerogenes]|nr:cupin domain-containing protein [Vibrio aerogenes]
MMNQTISAMSRDNEREWYDTPYAGVRFSWLSEHTEPGRAAVLRFECGGRLPVHYHPGWEQIFILEGQFQINDQIFSRHDFVFLSAGTRHSVEALTAGSYLTLAEKEGVDIG